MGSVLRWPRHRKKANAREGCRLQGPFCGNDGNQPSTHGMDGLSDLPKLDNRKKATVRRGLNTPFAVVRQQGSKVLSVLTFLSGSGDSTKTASATSCGAPGNDHIAKAMPLPPARESAGSHAIPRLDVYDVFPNANNTLNTSAVPLKENASLDQTRAQSTGPPTKSDNGCPQTRETSSKRNNPSHHVFCRSESASLIASPFERKLALASGQPATIRRPRVRFHPSLRVSRLSTSGLKTESSPQLSLPDTTELSSFQNSRSVSTGDLSSAKTSLESSCAQRIRTSKSRPGKSSTPAESVIEGARLTSGTLVPREESQVAIQPTIKTVETTANAKVFFETHFNCLFSEVPEARSVRQRELEEKLSLSCVTPEERAEARLRWLRQESNHLRQSRALKSRGARMLVSGGISVAGFEVIRVLGKGSFGVVRLVRKRDEALPERVIWCTRAPPLVPRSMGPLSPGFNSSRTLRPRSEASTTAEVFAMKVIRKSEMLRNSQEGHLRAERDFLVASEKSRWVVPLIASFQDRTNLYLVMDYMIGGDFLGLLIKRDRLEEARTRFYVAEMLLCLEEAHRLRWIHRDVKPDNFLISASGHLKISDFGLAFDGHWAHDQSYFSYHRYSLLEKLGIHVRGDLIDRANIIKDEVQERCKSKLRSRKERLARQRHHKPSTSRSDPDENILQWRNRRSRRAFARSAVGTSQYMAPEVIKGEDYDGRCDWWSLGIIMFECLYGETPFLGKDRQATKLNILRHDELLRFPENQKIEKRFRVSRSAKDLMSRLLQAKQYRLCSRKYLANDFHRNRRRESSIGSDSGDPVPRHPRGCFVFPDDASDIKAHPFFGGIDWQQLHKMRPPEVPKVKDCLDTRYFDQEGPISDVDDSSSSSSTRERQMQAQEEFEDQVVKAYEQEMAKGQHTGPTDECRVLDDIVETERMRQNVAEGARNAGALKERKRPRDRILRDLSVANEALELRKVGAFVGYTYRRPREILAQLEVHGLISKIENQR